MSELPAGFDTNVFINCPFDSAYLDLLRPILFSIVWMGYTPRISTERSDSAEVRLHKIVGLIHESRFSVHDLSRMRSKKAGEFARMNMPFELGMDVGCRTYGGEAYQEKRCLVLATGRYDYMKALSDLSGVDIEAHEDDPKLVVRALRNWFVTTVGLRGVASPSRLWNYFTDFTAAFYLARKQDGFTDEDLNIMPIPEYVDFIRDWVSGAQAAA
jgi:hypothetical protein